MKTIINFIQDSKYKKNEIESYLNNDPSTKNSKAFPNRGYYTVGDFVIIYTNINIASTNINGVVYDYNNFFCESDKTIVWESAQNENLKTPLLKKMFNKETRVLLFYRDSVELQKTGEWKYHGEVTNFRLLTSLSEKPAKFKLEFAESTPDASLKIFNEYDINMNVSNSALTGLKGEIFVYKNIIKIIDSYKNEIGFSNLKEIENMRVKWMYVTNQLADHDFEINDDIVVEVKTSTSSIESGFVLSQKEHQLLNKTIKENKIYALVNVWNIDKDQDIKFNVYVNDLIFSNFDLQRREVFYGKKKRT